MRQQIESQSVGCSDVLAMRNRILLSCWQDLIRNLQQSHSSFCDTINMCTINLIVFSNLIPRVSWLFDREECVFLHIKKSTWPGNEVLYSVFE